jgi:hypothetical protein
VSLTGPAIAQVRLLWSSRYECSPNKTPAGFTIFTMFPDGRIVRADQLADDTIDPLVASSCACIGTGSTFLFSSFWTLNATLFTSITVPPAALTGLPAPGDVINDVTSACLDGPVHHLAVAGDAMRVYEPTNATLALEHAYTPAMPPQIADYHFQSGSTFVFDTSCATALARAAERVAPPMLSINQVKILPSSIDGIYGGEGPDLSTSQTVTDDHVELQGELAGSFAVWFGFPHDVDALTVRKNGGEVAYIPQRVRGQANEWILWFEQGLVRTDTISIDAR